MFKLFAATVASVAMIGVLVVWLANTHGSQVPVFDGVSDGQLAQSGITIIDPNPSEHATISQDEATRSLVSQEGVTLESAQLVRVRVAPGGAVPPRPSGELLTWAVRLDTSGVSATSEYFGTGTWFRHSIEPTIAFVDAGTGQYLRSFTR